MSNRITLESGDSIVRRNVEGEDRDGPTWPDYFHILIESLRGLGYSISDEKETEIMETVNK